MGKVAFAFVLAAVSSALGGSAYGATAEGTARIAVTALPSDCELPSVSYDASARDTRLVSGSFESEGERMSSAWLGRLTPRFGWLDRRDADARAALVVETSGLHDRPPSSGPFFPSARPRPVFYLTAGMWAFDAVTHRFLLGTGCGITRG